MKGPSNYILVSFQPGRGFEATVVTERGANSVSFLGRSKTEALDRATDHAEGLKATYNEMYGEGQGDYQIFDLSDDVPLGDVNAGVEPRITEEDITSAMETGLNYGTWVAPGGDPVGDPASLVSVSDVRFDDGEVHIDIVNSGEETVTIWRRVGDRSGTKKIEPGEHTLTYKADEEDADVEIRLGNEDGEVIHSA